MGGAVASWLVRAVRVQALAGDIVLCSWARHFTPTVPLSTLVYKWVPANLMRGVTLRWTSMPSRGEKKYSQSLHATETGISFGLMGHLARMQTLALPFYPYVTGQMKAIKHFHVALFIMLYKVVPSFQIIHETLVRHHSAVHIIASYSFVFI